MLKMDLGYSNYRQQGSLKPHTASQKLLLILFDNLLLAILIYSILNIVLGQSGIFAYLAMKQERVAMQINIEALSKINSQLKSDFDTQSSGGLSTLRDASNLGLVKEHEGEIIIGQRQVTEEIIQTGQVLSRQPALGISDLSLKICALCLAFIIYLVSKTSASGFDFLRKKPFRSKHSQSHVPSESVGGQAASSHTYSAKPVSIFRS